MSGEVRAWIFPSTGAFSSWTANIWRTFPSLFIHHQSMSIAHLRVKLGARKIKNKKPTTTTTTLLHWLSFLLAKRSVCLQPSDPARTK